MEGGGEEAEQENEGEPTMSQMVGVMLKEIQKDWGLSEEEDGMTQIVTRLFDEMDTEGKVGGMGEKEVRTVM